MVNAIQLNDDVFCLALGNLLANCYIVRFEDKAIIIDPGDESVEILNFLAKIELTPAYILITHVHFDHVGAAYQLQQQFDVPIFIHKADERLIEMTCNMGEYLSDVYHGFIPTRFLSDGEILYFGDKNFRVIHTPGHSPGSICFLMDKMLFGGDLVFAGGGYGRTDLWDGSYDEIMRSIVQKVMTLPGDTMICPGHGPMSYVKDEAPFHDIPA